MAEVLLDPRHPYTLGLVRSAPDFDNVRELLVPIPGPPPSLITPPPGCRFRTRCPIAQPRCAAEEDPALTGPAAAPGHLAACPYAFAPAPAFDVAGEVKGRRG